MKILMATHYFGSHKGGIESVADRLFRALAVRGQEVVWVASDVTSAPEPIRTSRPVSLQGSNFVEKKIGVPFPFPTLGALKKIHSEISRTDILVLHDCLGQK